MDSRGYSFHFFFFINRGQKVRSTVKNTGYFSRGPRADPHHIHGGSQLPLSPIPKHLPSSSGLDMHMVQRKTCRQITHIHIQINKPLKIKCLHILKIFVLFSRVWVFCLHVNLRHMHAWCWREALVDAMQVLEIQSGSYGRAASILNHWANSLVPFVF